MFSRAVILPLLASGILQVQAQTVSAQESPKPARPDQTIEHIEHEDQGARIDELRVGGETRSITVNPKIGKGTAPAYEVTPESNNRNPATSDGKGEGRARWTIFSY